MSGLLTEDFIRFVFKITDKAKASRGGGKRCRCYERRRDKLEETEVSHTLDKEDVDASLRGKVCLL